MCRLCVDSEALFASLHCNTTGICPKSIVQHNFIFLHKDKTETYVKIIVQDFVHGMLQMSLNGAFYDVSMNLSVLTAYTMLSLF